LLNARLLTASKPFTDNRYYDGLQTGPINTKNQRPIARIKKHRNQNPITKSAFLPLRVTRLLPAALENLFGIRKWTLDIKSCAVFIT